MTPLGILKIVAAPGSLTFLALGCALGLFIIYVWPRQRTVGRWWLFGLFASYIVLGCPYVGQAITATLPPLDPQPDTGNRSVDTLVVFGGDNARGRVREAVKAYRELTPATVLVSGEDWLVERLREAGIPPDRIRQDKQSATTRQQMEMVTTLASQRSLAIVASRLQMPRVAALASRTRIAPRLLASPVDIEPPTSGFRSLIPSYAGLRVSRDAFYERVAICYYQSRGWIGTTE